MDDPGIFHLYRLIEDGMGMAAEDQIDAVRRLRHEDIVGDSQVTHQYQQIDFVPVMGDYFLAMAR